MDIQKEREAFEKECRLLCYKGNMVMSNLGSFYNNEQTNWMWQMWLSAKAQAVPEGFIVVPMEPTEQILNRMTNAPIEVNHLCDNADIFLSEDEARIAYKAMIEAQEPAND